MTHYKEIDTNWDDLKGWGEYTKPFLDSLHPVTGNLVEHAVRVEHSYKKPVVQQLLYKVDNHIRELLGSPAWQDPKEFDIKNYSPEEIAKVSSYVRNLLRVFRAYYQTADEDQLGNALKCVDMTVGHLREILERIESALEKKVSPLCVNEEAKKDVRELVALMDAVQEQGIDKNFIHSSVRIGNPESIDGDLFENPMEVIPPLALRFVESMVQIDCPNFAKAISVSHKIRRSISDVDISFQEGDEPHIVIAPTSLGTDDVLSYTAIQNKIKAIKGVLVHEKCEEIGAFEDHFHWTRSRWKIG